MAKAAHCVTLAKKIKKTRKKQFQYGQSEMEFGTTTKAVSLAPIKVTKQQVDPNHGWR